MRFSRHAVKMSPTASAWFRSPHVPDRLAEILILASRIVRRERRIQTPAIRSIRRAAERARAACSAIERCPIPRRARRSRGGRCGRTGRATAVSDDGQRRDRRAPNAGRARASNAPADARRRLNSSPHVTAPRVEDDVSHLADAERHEPLEPFVDRAGEQHRRAAAARPSSHRRSAPRRVEAAGENRTRRSATPRRHRFRRSPCHDRRANTRPTTSAAASAE